MKEDRSRVSRFMLYMEMILAAPGKGLHVLLKKCRKRGDIGRALFLLCTLLLVGIALWLMRKNTLLLLAGGIALAVLAFLSYKAVMKGIAALLLWLEKATGVFAASFDDCRRILRKRPARRRSRKTPSGNAQQANAPHAGPGQKQEQKKTREQREAERQAWEEAKQKARAEKRYRQTQQKKKRMEEEAERERAKRGGPKATNKQSPRESNEALEEAKSIFNVEIPFTEAEIKEKRNLLIKKYHPDNPEGSEEMCKKINECYAILYKYAV
ncbi:MAG: J domain-containing protein [Lachnospiraceae bacterium]|nr:J domain-containing protein [Lachnospiraceae bacterium]